VTPERIARVAHEANRAYCASIGDLSQPTWDSAPAWQRDSAVAGVKRALAYPSSTPEESHQAWLDLKRKEGWRFGEAKDPTKKQHPCMVLYADLPEEQQRKDALFLAVVRALAP
jgi:hypothetical protein